MGYYKHYIELKYPSLLVLYSVSTQSSRERFLDSDYAQVTGRFAGYQHDSNYIASEAQLTTDGTDDACGTREDMEQQD